MSRELMSRELMSREVMSREVMSREVIAREVIAPKPSSLVAKRRRDLRQRDHGLTRRQAHARGHAAIDAEDL